MINFIKKHWKFILMVTAIISISVYNITKAVDENLTENEKFEIEQIDGRFFLQFTATKNFTIEWYKIPSTTWCLPRQSEDDAHIMPTFYGLGITTYGFTNLDGFDINCNNTETFVQGQTYTMWLMKGTNIINEGDSSTTVWGKILNDTVNPEITSDVPLTLMETLTGASYWSKVIYLTNTLASPTITINTPEDENSTYVPFDLYFNYSSWTGWNRLGVTFEKWNSSSTCPTYPGTAYQEEISKNWLIYRTDEQMLNMDPTIASGYGVIRNIQIPALTMVAQPGVYNCVKCTAYHWNAITNEIDDIRTNLCPNYSITVLGNFGTSTPEISVSSTQFWVDNIPEMFWSSSSPPNPGTIYTTITGTAETILTTAQEFSNKFRNAFNKQTAIEQASTTANKINSVIGYGLGIKQIIADFPIFTLIAIFIGINLIVLVIKGIWYITHIKP